MKKRHNAASWGSGAMGGFTAYRYGEATRPPVKPILSKDRRASVCSRVVDLLRDWRDHRWEGEAAVRYGVRRALVLEGHDWHSADEEASNVVRHAFNTLGRGKETRPSEDEGQHYFTEPRENCRWCHDPIDEEDMSRNRSRMFCSPEHAKRAFLEWGMQNASHGNAMQREAYRAVYRERLPLRQCLQCSNEFKPPREKADTRFCSMVCHAAHRTKDMPERTCDHCQKTFRLSTRHAGAKFCGRACADAAKQIHQPKACEACGCTFIPTKAKQKACSLSCGQAVATKTERSCQTCGATFRSSRGAVRCSRECRRIPTDVRTGRIVRLKPRVFDYFVHASGAQITDALFAAAA